MTAASFGLDEVRFEGPKGKTYPWGKITYFAAGEMLACDEVIEFEMNDGTSAIPVCELRLLGDDPACEYFEITRELWERFRPETEEGEF